MTGFDDREKAFEAKFKQDQETQFKVRARRNRLLGAWAAGRLGLAGAQADAYATQVVESDFAKPGDDDVIEKLTKDFAAKGVATSEAEIRGQLERLLPEAKRMVFEDKK